MKMPKKFIRRKFMRRVFSFGQFKGYIFPAAENLINFRNFYDKGGNVFKKYIRRVLLFISEEKIFICFKK